MLDDVNIHNQYTGNNLEEEKTNDQSKVNKKHHHKVHRKDDEINNDLPHSFDGLELKVVGKDINDRRQEEMAMEGVDPMTKNTRVVDAVIMDWDQICTNAMNDIEAQLSPIVGYAVEPLLPLAEACAPLTDILYDLPFYVKMALDETPEKPPNGLTIDESAAVRLYTIEWSKPHRSLYSMINHTLKKDDREHLRPYFKYMKLFLTALIKIPCAPPSTIWRGITKNMSAEFPPGTPVTWWAFSSCTTSLTVLENHMYLGNTGDRTLFSVETINGRTIKDHSHFVTEDEMLLLPGTYMVVQSQLSPAPGLYIIHLKQVIPDEILLEPPFEGILNVPNRLI